MRVAVSSYSFGDYLSKDKMGIRGCMEWAKEQGFEGFELVQHNLERYDVDLNEIAECSKEFDLPIVAYLVYKNFLMDGGKHFDKVVDSAIADVDKAAFVGSPMFRHDVVDGVPHRQLGKSFDEIFNMLADGSVEFGIQGASCGDHPPAGNPKFKLSAFAASDVSGVSGVGGKVFAGTVVFGVDMVQPAQRNRDQMRHTVVYCGSSGEQFSFAALQRIVF
jgi:hypothetical protein